VTPFGSNNKIRRIKMSFWDKVKSVTRAAKCLVGWHGGEYSHISGEPLCHLGKTCPYCESFVTKVEHAFTQWEFPEPDRCGARRECEHCGHVEISVRHNYVRTGKDERNCEVISTCRRCGDETRGSAEHEWEALELECRPEGESSNKKKCKSCGVMAN
jgi:hypothetical protein